MVAWLLLLTVQRYAPTARVGYYYLAAVTVLVMTTGISYATNLLLPDVFTPILFLASFHLALLRDLRWPQRVGVGFLFALALSTHLSHFPTLFLTLLGGGLLGWLRRRQSPLPLHRQGLFTLAGIATAVFLLVPTFNALSDGHFRFTAGGSIFFTNRLRDMDIVQDFLAEDCAHHAWKLCPFKDALYGDFLWDPNSSALYKTGGWEANYGEYRHMNRAILARPRFIARYLRGSLEEGIRQFFVFETGPARPYIEESAPVSAIKDHMQANFRACFGSKQIRGLIDFQALNRRQEWIVLGSMAFLLMLALDRKRFMRLPADLRWLVLMLLLFATANAVVCAAFSNIVPRYQSRLVWLFPFTATLVGIAWMERHDLPGRLRRWLGNAPEA